MVTKSQIIFWGKLVLFLALTYALYYHFFVAQEFGALWLHFQSTWQWTKLPFLFIAILLMPINWLLETLKWKILLHSPSKFSQLIKGVSAGVTFGFITPGRAGEFVGRTFYLEEVNKVNVFFLSLVGGLAQTVVTLVVGSIMYSLSTFYQPFLAGLAIGVTIVFLLLYFRFDLLNSLLTALPFLSNRKLVMQQADLPNLGTLFRVLLFSAVRYFVYLSQYVLLMMYVGVDISTWKLYLNNALVLLLQTFSPLMPYLDFTYRGSVAVFIFEPQTQNTIAVFLAVTLVWMINLVIPALVGYFFIWRHKFQYLKQN